MAQGDDGTSSENQAFAIENPRIIIETQTHEEQEEDGVRRLRDAARGLQQQSQSQLSPPKGSGNYDITLRYLTSITSAQKSAFEYAAERIGRMITTKLGNLSLPSRLRCNFVPDVVLPNTIQEMYILVKINPIDGLGGVLAQAAPCIKDSNDFPRVGYMEFDVADVNSLVSLKQFDAVVVHEMMHILGFGTNWPDLNLVKGATDPRYHGPIGTAALSKIGGTYMGTPTVEDEGGQGSAGSHWRESVFEGEMMTSRLSAAYQPISSLTVDSFRDLGYTVDASASDSYSVRRFNNIRNVALDTSGVGTPFVPGSPTTPPAGGSSPSGGGLAIWIYVVIAVSAFLFFVSIVSAIARKRRRPSMPAPPPPNQPSPFTSANYGGNHQGAAANGPVYATPVYGNTHHQQDIPQAVVVT